MVDCKNLKKCQAGKGKSLKQIKFTFSNKGESYINQYSTNRESINIAQISHMCFRETITQLNSKDGENEKEEKHEHCDIQQWSKSPQDGPPYDHNFVDPRHDVQGSQNPSNPNVLDQVNQGFQCFILVTLRENYIKDRGEE